MFLFKLFSNFKRLFLFKGLTMVDSRHDLVNYKSV